MTDHHPKPLSQYPKAIVEFWLFPVTRDLLARRLLAAPAAAVPCIALRMMPTDTPESLQDKVHSRS